MPAKPDVASPTGFQAVEFIVTAVNVLYHGTQSDFENAVSNVISWLRPEGLFYFTCCGDGDPDSVNGRQIAPDTYELEKGHVHYCSNRERLLVSIRSLRIVSLHRCEHYHNESGNWEHSVRWRVLCQNPGTPAEVPPASPA